MENETQINNTFVFHYEWIADLDDCDKSRFAFYCIDFAIHGKEPESLAGIELSYWKRVKAHILYDKTEYVKKSSVENGRKGGAPKGNSNATKTTKKQPRNNQKTTIISNELLVMNNDSSVMDYENELSVMENEREGEKSGDFPAAPAIFPAPAQTQGTKSQRFIPPTLDEVRAHVREKGYAFSPEAFIAHYTSNGWLVGKNKMKDWRAACVTWQRRENEYSSGSQAAAAYQRSADYDADF